MKTKQHIAITGHGAVGPWGNAGQANTLISRSSYISRKTYDGQTFPVAPLSADPEKVIAKLKNSNKTYKKLDRSVLLGILAAREAMANIDVGAQEKIGINIGSSRGATATFEKHHQDFLESGKTSPYASPTTTLGNLSSWVMEDLGLNGPILSHSITCSTAIQALANGMAWLRAGMADHFLAGGAEAPLTPFTLAQMQALKIYAKDDESDYPCRPLAKNPVNGMVLGEGAAGFLLTACDWNELIAMQPLALLESAGFGNEPLEGFTGISKEGTSFQKAMKMALESQETGFDVDLILMHAPGTVKGDQAELSAVKKVFGNHVPMLYSNKWQIGHTFGASAALSLVQALEILHSQQLPQFPYKAKSTPCQPPIRKIMINAAGFGGNAGSVIVSSPF